MESEVLFIGEPGNEQATQFPFYMLYQNEEDRGFPNKAGLAHLLGDTVGQRSSRREKEKFCVLRNASSYWFCGDSTDTPCWH